MSPLMQTICDELRMCGLDRYIDGFQRDAFNTEFKRLYNALAAVLPDSCLELLDQYSLIMRAQSLLETEAMFQAAFAAARELT